MLMICDTHPYLRYLFLWGGVHYLYDICIYEYYSEEVGFDGW